MHIVLLGDAVFDNAPYVGQGFDVQTYLRRQFPSDEVTLLAVDEATIENIPEQLVNFPFSVTHMALSVGGNNLLQYVPLGFAFAGTIGLAMARVSDVILEFERSYLQLVQKLLRFELPLVLCTLYHPSYKNPMEQKAAVITLSLINDVIYRIALQHQLPLLEMRSVCTSEADFIFQNEPSEQGGAKIAAALARVLQEHDFTKGRTTVYGS